MLSKIHEDCDKSYSYITINGVIGMVTKTLFPQRIITYNYIGRWNVKNNVNVEKK